MTDQTAKTPGTPKGQKKKGLLGVCGALAVQSVWIVLVAAATCTGADPAEMARERGALELLRSWPCGPAGDLGRVVGGDLKTDWSAARQPDGSYRVTVRLPAGEEAFGVRPAERSITPLSHGAQKAWQGCATRPPG